MIWLRCSREMEFLFCLIRMRGRCCWFRRSGVFFKKLVRLSTALREVGAPLSQRMVFLVLNFFWNFWNSWMRPCEWMKWLVNSFWLWIGEVMSCVSFCTKGVAACIGCSFFKSLYSWALRWFHTQQVVLLRSSEWNLLRWLTSRTKCSAEWVGCQDHVSKICAFKNRILLRHLFKDSGARSREFGDVNFRLNPLIMELWSVSLKRMSGGLSREVGTPVHF